MKKILFLLLLTPMLIASCKKEESVTLVTPKVIDYLPMTIGGITWAATNIDDSATFAAKPDMYTKFYQWNRGKAWAIEGSVTEWETDIEGLSWTVNPCPTGWRLPTRNEFTALDKASGGNPSNGIQSGTWVEANERGNAVAGRFYGVNHTTCSLPDSMKGCIFLPASGTRGSNGAGVYSQGIAGYYWSSISWGSNLNGFVLRLNNEVSDPDRTVAKSHGISIRCVKE